MVEALELSAYQLEVAHNLRVTHVDAHVKHAAISGVNLWGPASIRLLSPKWMAAVGPETSKSWLVMSVTLDTTLNVELERTGPAPSGSGSGAGAGAGGNGTSGADGSKLTMQLDRRGTWLLARGPLPKGFSRTLYSKWYVLGWW